MIGQFLQLHVFCFLVNTQHRTKMGLLARREWYPRSLISDLTAGVYCYNRHTVDCFGVRNNTLG